MPTENINRDNLINLRNLLINIILDYSHPDKSKQLTPAISEEEGFFIIHDQNTNLETMQKKLSPGFFANEGEFKNLVRLINKTDINRAILLDITDCVRYIDIALTNTQSNIKEYKDKISELLNLLSTLNNETTNFRYKAGNATYFGLKHAREKSSDTLDSYNALKPHIDEQLFNKITVSNSAQITEYMNSLFPEDKLDFNIFRTPYRVRSGSESSKCSDSSTSSDNNMQLLDTRIFFGRFSNLIYGGKNPSRNEVSIHQHTNASTYQPTTKFME